MSPALLALVSIIAQILTGLIPQLHVSQLSKNIITLVDELLKALPTLWSAIKGGGATTIEVTAALTAIQTVAQEAQQDTTLDPATLSWIVALDNAAQKALAADTAAQAKVEPDTLTDIAPLP